MGLHHFGLTGTVCVSVSVRIDEFANVCWYSFCTFTRVILLCLFSLASAAQLHSLSAKKLNRTSTSRFLAETKSTLFRLTVNRDKCSPAKTKRNRSCRKVVWSKVDARIYLLFNCEKSVICRTAIRKCRPRHMCVRCQNICFTAEEARKSELQHLNLNVPNFPRKASGQTQKSVAVNRK